LVTIVVGDHCPLCEKALRAAEQVAAKLPFTLEVKQVSDNDPRRDRVPVVLVDGRERMHGRVGRVLLEREVRVALRAGAPRAGPP
jgi:hypothetical protein